MKNSLRLVRLGLCFITISLLCHFGVWVFNHLMGSTFLGIFGIVFIWDYLMSYFGLLQKEYVLTDVTNNTLHSIPTDFLYAISATFNDGTEVAINDERQNFIDDIDYNVSILFPAPFKVLVKGIDTKSPPKDDISIIYVSIPPVLTLTTDFADLPQVYNEALYNYVAYKAHASVKGDMKAENNTYYLRYNESIKNIRLLGMRNSDNLDSNVKLTDRGFV